MAVVVVASVLVACSDTTADQQSENLEADPHCTVQQRGEARLVICDDGFEVLVVDGEHGARCVIEDDGDGLAIVVCEDRAATTVRDGGVGRDGEDGRLCSVDDGENGGRIVVYEDGTTATIPDGADGRDGEDGRDGDDGEDGTSCTVEDDGNGGKRIHCEDGTMATIPAFAGGQSDAAVGPTTLIQVREEPAGSASESGGQRIETGLDDGAGEGLPPDGVLHPDEVDATSFACHGTVPCHPSAPTSPTPTFRVRTCRGRALGQARASSASERWVSAQRAGYAVSLGGRTRAG